MAEDPELPIESSYPRTLKPAEGKTKIWRILDRTIAILHIVWFIAILVGMYQIGEFDYSDLYGFAAVVPVAALYWFANIPTMAIATLLALPCSGLAYVVCDVGRAPDILHQTHGYVWLPGIYALVRAFQLAFEKQSKLRD